MKHTYEDTEVSRLFSGPGEMRALMREMDWACTPVGSISSWPQSLKSTVRILLASQYPMVLTWGSEFTQFYNDAYAKLIGSGHPAALGNDIRITLAEGWATLGPMIDTVMRTGIANWTPALPLLMERSGYREEAYFSVSHAPAENDDGQIVGMLAVCSEVTAQVIGERRLRLLRGLSSKAGDVNDVRSACEALGSALSDDPLDIPFAAIWTCGKQGLELRSAVDFPKALADTLPLDEAFATKTAITTRVTSPNVAAGGLWNDPVREVKILPLEGRGNDPVGLLVVAISPARELDEAHEGFFELLQQQASITLRNAGALEEERQRAQELAALDKAKTDFFSNVSHEFRTPLTLMLGPLEELIATDPNKLSGRAQDLDLIHRNAMRLLRLVNTLLEFSRVEAGRIEALLEPTELAQFTAEIASSFRSAAQSAGLQLDVDLADLPYPVRIDRGMWEKIILNLISNALKHTRLGSIIVNLEDRDGSICLVVSDTGVGIAQEDLPRIFERFHRIENAQARSFEGSGIGLALVRELVALLGGTIDAESQPGVGTRFTVTLPSSLYAPDAVAMTASRADPSSRAFAEEAVRWTEPRTATDPRKGLPKVLLADDNADMRDYIARLLHHVGDVTVVADGDAALAALNDQPFDLVLTDVMMPRLDGFGLIAKIRETATLAPIPVIMLSARAGEDSRVDGLEAGADDYLVKPFSARELVARVRANLELSRMRRELAEAEARVAKLEAIGQLTGGVAHDFNNLLTAITGSLELLSRRAGDRPDLMRFVSVAQAGAARGAKLTGQLLAFARRQPLAPTLIDVSTQLREFLPLLQGAVGDTVELAFKPAPIPQPCRVDARQLEVAVLNLVINARDASQSGARVEVEVLPEGRLDAGLVSICVSDHGHGMSAETAKQAVEPFFTTKDIGAGTGLGLSQVYGFAQQSGGRLEIESSIGAGTTVRILLPIEHAAPATKSAAAPEPVSGANRIVLLVEDEHPVRMIAAEVLKEAGYRVIEAADGPDALVILDKGERIDALVTDVSMPKSISGVDLAQRARTMRPDLPVLLTSGYAEVLSRDDHGFPLLAKPYAFSELLRKLEELISLQR